LFARNLFGRSLHECAPVHVLRLSVLSAVLNRKQWFSSRSCISGHTMREIAVIASFVLWTLFRSPNEETTGKKRDFREPHATVLALKCQYATGKKYSTYPRRNHFTQ